MFSSSSSSQDSTVHPSPQEWNAILGQVAQSNRESAIAPQQSRKCIYINSAQQMEAFDSKSAAKKAGYGKRLKFWKIVEITKEIMSQCVDENVKQEAILNLRSIGFYKASRFDQKNKLIQIVSRDTLTIEKSLDIGADVISLTDSLITPAKLESIYQTVMNAEQDDFSRSTGGDKGGVYFFNIGERIALKIDKDPAKHLLADRFLKKMGFVTPSYCVFSIQTELGSQIHQKLTTLGQEYYDKELNLAQKSQLPTIDDEEIERQQPLLFTEPQPFSTIINDDEELSALDTRPPPFQLSADTIKMRRTFFNSDMKKCDFIIGMDYLNALPFKILENDQMLADLRDPEFLQNLGEVMFFDAVINNSDRMSPTSSNFGNIMRRNDGDIQIGEKKIALLDHDYLLSMDTYDKCEMNITQLLTGERTRGTLKKFIQLLPEAVADQLSEDEIANHILPAIMEGVRYAAMQFVQEFSDQAAAIEMLQVPPDTKMSHPNYRVLMSLVAHTQQELKSNILIM